MKIGIVGSGFVGSTAAYALVMRGLGSEIVLTDINPQRAQAEADDILHAVPFVHAADVYAGGYPELSGSRIVIITAGTAQKPGETRLQLLGRNAGIVRGVMEQVLTYAPEAVIVIVSNPVDVMTHLAARFAAERGLPPGRVFGSGTMLDTARFRALLGQQVGVDPQHVHGYVVGEHGDSEVLTWSLVSVSGLPLDEFVRLRGVCLDPACRQEIDDRVRHAAYRIIEGKGATYYGIGAALSRIVDVVLHNHQAILTVCSPMPEVAGVPDVTLSLPHLVTGAGVVGTLPLALDARESEALRTSARIIREAIADYDQAKPGGEK